MKGSSIQNLPFSETCLSGLYDSKSLARSLSESGAASCWLIGLARLTVNTKPNNTARTKAFIVQRHCETYRPFTEENCILARLNSYCASWKGQPKALDCVNLQKYLPLFFQISIERHDFRQYLCSFLFSNFPNICCTIWI